jgi:hypothetical protein
MSVSDVRGKRVLMAVQSRWYEHVDVTASPRNDHFVTGLSAVQLSG